MNDDRARRIANLSLEQRRLLELMLQERAQTRVEDEGIPALHRYSESGGPAVFQLSSVQRWLWFNEQRRSDDAAQLLMPLPMRLRGSLDVAALEASLCEICARHEAFRTAFSTRESGEPVQTVGPPRPVLLPLIDLRELSPSTREAEAQRLLVREAWRPFDLSGGLMLRATLLRLDDEEHVLLLITHHIVSDGWSMDVLFRELWAIYKALRSGERASLPELPVQYVDYAVWQQQRLQEGALLQQVEYWKKQLADAPAVLDVPADHPRPPARTSLAGGRRELRIGDPLLGELRALCRRQNVTPYMALLAAWAALLHRYSGQDDLLIASPFANRNRAEVEGVIGYFANTLVLRLDLSGDPSFAELLRRVHETTTDAFWHGELSFEKLVEGLRPRAFRIRFALRDVARSIPEPDGLRVERFEIDRRVTTPFLTLVAIEGDDGLTARLVYNAHLFEDTTAVCMLEHYRILLESIVADPEQRVSEPPLPSKAAGAWRTRFEKWLRLAASRARRAAGRRLNGKIERAGRRHG